MSKERVRRASRWVLSVLLLGAGFVACGGKATESDDGTKAGAPSTSLAGSGGGSTFGPARGGQHQGPAMGGKTGQGVGGSRGPSRPVPGDAGAAGTCSLEDRCGGCDQGFVSVLCSWGSIELPYELVVDELFNDHDAVCKASQQHYAASQSSGGAGGVGAGGASAGGEGGEGPIRPGLCASYVSPGTSIISCDGCTETESQDEVGQCNIGGECCVLVKYQYCGT